MTKSEPQGEPRPPAAPADRMGGKRRIVYTQPLEPRPPLEDAIGYRIAVGAVGISLVAFLIGAAIIAAGGNPVPTEYWSAGSGLAGGLLGILAPNPTKNQPTVEAKQERPVISEIVTVLKDVWDNRTVVLLLILFVGSAVLAAWKNSPELETVAAAAGGALVGLLAPPPGNKAGGGQ